MGALPRLLQAAQGAVQHAWLGGSARSLGTEVGEDSGPVLFRTAPHSRDREWAPPPLRTDAVHAEADVVEQALAGRVNPPAGRFGHAFRLRTASVSSGGAGAPAPLSSPDRATENGPRRPCDSTPRHGGTVEG